MSADAAAFVAQAATVLLGNGQTTEGTRQDVERLALALDWPAKFHARWGEFVLQRPDGPVFGEVAPLGVDIARVMAAQAVIDAACDGRIDRSEGLVRLAAVGRSRPVALTRFAPMAAISAAALAIIFGAPDGLTIGLIALSAGAGALLRRGVSHVSGNPFAQPLAAALLAGLDGGLVTQAGLPVAAWLVTLCPCMVLVPGPHFLNGGLDLAHARIPIGLGRTALAGLIILAICAGLLTGLALTGAPFPRADTLITVPVGLDVLAAGAAVAGFGSFFNIPWRLMPLPILVGMAGHAVHWWLVQAGSSLPGSAFGAALLVGTVMAPLAHRLRIPFGAFAFSGVCSMMPGALMFEAASATVATVRLGAQAEAAAVLPIVVNAAVAVLVTLGLTAGLILPRMLYEAYLARSRRG